MAPIYVCINQAEFRPCSDCSAEHGPRNLGAPHSEENFFLVPVNSGNWRQKETAPTYIYIEQDPHICKCDAGISWLLNMQQACGNPLYL